MAQRSPLPSVDRLLEDVRAFRLVLKAFVVVGVVAACGCTSSETEPRATQALVPAPGWVTKYCADAARTIERPVLCPVLVPEGILATENLQVLRPSPTGYVFEGQAETHWVFATSPGDVEGDYGVMRGLGTARIRESHGRWLYAPNTAGIHANHLVLTWREGGFHYTVSAHTEKPGSAKLRAELLSVAKGMRLHQ